MNKRIRVIGISTFVAFFFSMAASFGQQKDGIEYSGFFDTYYYRGPLNITVGGGATTMAGDIYSYGENISYFGTLGASYQVWPRTYFGADFSYMNFKGSESNSRGYNFDHTGLQVDLLARFLLIDKTVTRHGQLKQKPYQIRPYITAGIGSFAGLSNSQSITTYDSTVIKDYGFSNAALTVPVGIGFQIWLSHRVSIMPEFMYRFAFNDLLDGIQLNSGSGMDNFVTAGLKIQFTPKAARVHKKKKSLPPPDQYDGPKGTDYPRKVEDAPAKRFGQPLPDESGTPAEGGSPEQELPNGETPHTNPDGQQAPSPEGEKAAPAEDNKSNDGWGW